MENNPFFLLSLQDGGGLAEHITLLLPDIAASRRSKKHPCFLVAILQHFFKPRQAHQDDGHEARRIIGFGWSFLDWSGYYAWFYIGNYAPWIVFPYPQPLRSVSLSSLSFFPPPLNYVNRFSTRLLLRISSKLENSSLAPLYLSGKERAGGI